MAGAGELLKQDASGAAAAAAAGEGGPSATKWGSALEAAVAALLRYSGAAEGDRTMLDALIPAQQHFTRALQQGKALHLVTCWSLSCTWYQAAFVHMNTARDGLCLQVLIASGFTCEELGQSDGK